MSDAADHAALMEAKRNELLQRLQKNQEERLAKKEARNALSVTNTGELPIFLKKFGEDVQKIKSDIKEMRKKFKLAAQTESKEEVKNMQTEEEERSKKVRAAAEAVDDAIDKLQASVAQSAFFMPSYELRQAKASIEKLYELCEAQKLKLLPKKRFCFKSRARRAALRAAQGNSSSSSLLSPPSPTEAATSTSAVRLRRQLDLLSSLQGVENSESIRDKKGEHIYRAFGSVNGKDIWLRQLENCTVTLCDRLGALRIDSVKNCTFLVGPIGGSIHLEHAENCTFVVACRQIRIHHAHSCDFYLAVQSNPIIEDCDKLRFAPYRFEFEQLQESIEGAGLSQAFEESNTKWKEVNDFKWLRRQASPNWEVLPEAERKPTFRPASNES